MVYSNLDYHCILGQILGNLELKSTKHYQITQPKFNWEPIVELASTYFVLPTLYYRLRTYSLLHHLPEELAKLIEQIARINHNRNQALIEQAKAIGACLEANQIPYVFLKGMALLLGGHYHNLGERMLGDIDVLVAPEQAQKAYTVLQSCLDYEVLQHQMLIKASHHHLPRLVKKKGLAAVELHTAVGKTIQIESLQTSSILANSRTVNGYEIPNSKVLLHHTVHHALHNNLGSIGKLSPGFRSYCDVLAIMQQDNIAKTYFESTIQLKAFASYHSLYDPRFTNYRLIIKWLYKTRLYYALFNRFWRFGWQTYIRLGLVFQSRHYRAQIMNRLFFKKKINNN